MILCHTLYYVLQSTRPVPGSEKALNEMIGGDGVEVEIYYGYDIN